MKGLLPIYFRAAGVMQARHKFWLNLKKKLDPVVFESANFLRCIA